MKGPLLLAFLMPLMAGCSSIDPCEVTPLQSVASPDKKHTIAVYSRGCGATTKDYTEISLLQAGEPIPNDSGNVVTLDDNGDGQVRVRWQDSSNVRLSFGAKIENQSASLDADGVQVHIND